MATSKKTSKTSAAKKPQVKVADMKPAKDAKGGSNVNARGGHVTNKNYLQ